MEKDWKEVNFKGMFKFSVPNSFSETNAPAIDSDFAQWEGKGITVQVDFGAFVDPLTSYVDHPNHKLLNGEIDGHPARIVEFDQDDGSHVDAIHLLDLTKKGGSISKKLTMIIRRGQMVGSEIPEKIIRSIQVPGETL